MNQQWCVKMMDRVAELERRVMELEAPQPLPAEAVADLGQSSYIMTAALDHQHKRKPGRPPKGQDNGTATPPA